MGALVVMLCIMMFFTLTNAYMAVQARRLGSRGQVVQATQRDDAASGTPRVNQVRTLLQKRKIADCMHVSELIDAIEGAGEGRIPTVDEVHASSWELQYSSLIPSGWFPIKEVVDFRPDFRLTSSFGALPLGTISGTSSVVSEDSAGSPESLTIRFVGTSIAFGPISFPLQQKPKTYTFFHMDAPASAPGNVRIVLSRSSSGGGTILTEVRRRED